MSLVINGRKEVTAKTKTYYLEDVNLSYSFKTLECIATDLGADLVEGDTLIVDNKKKDKRKAYRKSANGAIIIYAMLNGMNTFHPVIESKTGKAPMIDFIKR